ncbi:MAG: hypothetical protein ABFS46_11940, partial [Myxococcota bacterium]
TSFALVRAATGSLAASLAAGALTLWMPWRTAELPRIQLLAAHWFPLVWLLLVRALCAERMGWPRWALLSTILTLQLLTSYYLAYLLTLSLGLLGLAGWVFGRPATSRLGGLALALAPAYLLLGLVSIPYLGRRARGELPSALDPELPMRTLGGTWAELSPTLGTAWGQSGSASDPSYAIPLLVVVLLVLVPLAVAAPVDPPSRGRTLRTLTVGLVACLLSGFVLSLGTGLEVGGEVRRMPGWLFWDWVPGFSNLRAPQRWLILLGLAAPLLAGFSLAWLERRFLPAGAPRWLVAGATLALFAFVLLPRPLPVRAAFEDEESVRKVAEALRSLPPGPVVELPWPVDSLGTNLVDTRYQLASTLHWRPILNGSTAYPHPSTAFQRRIAQRLPDPVAVETLRRTAGLRWIVLHGEGGEALLEWDEAVARGQLRLAWSGPNARILEVSSAPDTGLWLEAVGSTQPRPTTLSGLGRQRLELGPEAGRLTAETPGRFRYAGNNAYPRPVSVTLTNDSELNWPGLDPQLEGLVALRFSFSEPGGGVVKTGTAALDADLPAGATRELALLVVPPTRRGHYRLCLDLVQRVGGTLAALPVAPLELEAEVHGIDAPRQGATGRFLSAFRVEESVPQQSACSPSLR